MKTDWFLQQFSWKLLYHYCAAGATHKQTQQLLSAPSSSRGSPIFCFSIFGGERIVLLRAPNELTPPLPYWEIIQGPPFCVHSSGNCWSDPERCSMESIRIRQIITWFFSHKKGGLLKLWGYKLSQLNWSQCSDDCLQQLRIWPMAPYVMAGNPIELRVVSTLQMWCALITSQDQALSA